MRLVRFWGILTALEDYWILMWVSAWYASGQHMLIWSVLSVEQAWQAARLALRLMRPNSKASLLDAA